MSVTAQPPDEVMMTSEDRQFAELMERFTQRSSAPPPPPGGFYQVAPAAAPPPPIPMSAGPAQPDLSAPRQILDKMTKLPEHGATATLPPPELPPLYWQRTPQEGEMCTHPVCDEHPNQHGISWKCRTCGGKCFKKKDGTVKVTALGRR
jgi:hypothetical protein